MPSNDTMMQYFEWYLPSDSTLWNKLTKEAKHLENIGLTYLWLPPAYKGAGGFLPHKGLWVQKQRRRH